MDELNMDCRDVEKFYKKIGVCCLECKNRSLLRTTCKSGLRQEWDKKRCAYFKEIFTKLRKEK